MRMFIWAVLASLVVTGCNGTNMSSVQSPNPGIGKVDTVRYSSLVYIDSFIAQHKTDIEKNNALKQKYEAIITKDLLPKIDKGGFFDDLPFKLVVTTIHEGQNYGNFVFDDPTHFAKVTCIITEKQINDLLEDSLYRIKFKVLKFNNGVSLPKEFSKIEFPAPTAKLLSFSKVN